MLKLVTSLAVLVATCGSAAALQPVAHAFRILDEEGHSSLLIPSLHVAARGIVQPTPEVLEGARVLVVEHVDEPGSSDPGAGRPERSPWAKAMTDAELKVYAQRAKCSPAPGRAEEALHRPSVQVANQLAYSSCLVVGRRSRDDLVGDEAKKRGLPRVGLEDARWVEAQRRKVAEEYQADAFHWILHHDVDQVLGAVAAAFNAGDFDQVKHLAAMSAGSEEGFLSSYQPMVVERNIHWMQALPTLLHEGDAVVIVGAMHIPGPDGLAQLLQDEGFEVQPITLPGVR